MDEEIKKYLDMGISEDLPAPYYHHSHEPCEACLFRDAYIERLEKRGFTYVSENGRELLVRMWCGEPWICYKHPDGQWVSLEKCAVFFYNGD